MPELPEVETIRRGLEKNIIGKKIADVEIVNKKSIKGGAVDFVRILKNNSFKNIGRIGKLLIMELEDDNFLLVHLKLTGQLIYVFGRKIVAGGHNFPRPDAGNLPLKYAWVIWKFKDGSRLYFNDMRKFGYLKIAGREEKEKIVSKFGVEPLTPSFTLANFKNILAGRKAPIKSVLMNQNLIAGIGNIYADEICFSARVLPDRKVRGLSDKEIKKLFASIRGILKKSIKRSGTTFRDYRGIDGQKGKFADCLKVYQREKEKCSRCRKGMIQKKRIGGRASRFCPVCQK